MSQKEIRSCSTTDMWNYASGEVANSLISNTIFGFAMLFYTDALGLSPMLAGIAMSVAIFWDAITDPLMGHISDNTKSRFGRRHQYMLFGGIGMVLAFFFIWAVPPVFRANNTSLFWYLVVVNIIMRTAYTVFVVPMTALGFEMCQDYTGRTKIQGIKSIFNMIANFCGPGLAWVLFFPKQGVDVKNPANFMRMGTIFAIISLISIFYLVFITRKYLKDSREMKTTGSSAGAFFKDLFEIVTDIRAVYVFLFAIVVILGVGLVAGLQMYVYEHFMLLSGKLKTITHGGTMIGCGLGSAFCARFARRFDKKGAVYVGGSITLLSGAILTALFVSKIVAPGQTVAIAGFNFPIAATLFALLGATYWFGNGVMFPVATSMMADISEINQLKTGVNKDGSYSAMYSLSMKISQSLSALIVGAVLTWTGFVTVGELMESGNYAVGFMEGSEMAQGTNAVIGIVARETDTPAVWGFVNGSANTIESSDTVKGFVQDAGVVQDDDAIAAYLTLSDMAPANDAVAVGLEGNDSIPADAVVSTYIKGASVTQSHSTVMKLFVATYIIGPVISITALILIWLYPVNKKVLEKLRAEAP
ncbi:MAG: hypothetical protein DRP64_11310 [Verrucomicrobia bacterium]|nr:MAG: hypothetical protein DRP64_11310 [Verrucomicrobiota bacterium]